MSSSTPFKHTVTNVAPDSASIGDEYYNPVTNQLFKRIVHDGKTVKWVNLSDSASQLSANDVLKTMSLLTNYSSITPNIIDTTSASYFTQNYGTGGTVNGGSLGSPCYVLWSTDGVFGTRGAYNQNMQRYDGTNFITPTYGNSSFYGPIIKNYAATSNMVINLYCRIYRANDDNNLWKIQYSDNGGAEVILSGSAGIGGGANQYVVVYNGTVSVPANTIRKFYCYAQVSGGTGLDHIVLTDFYTSFNSWA